MEDIVQFLSNEMFALTISMLGLAGVRFLMGAYAAFRDGTFVLSSVGAFLRSQVMGRVFPILTVAYFAAASDNVALVTAAGAASAAYVAESVGAIAEALSSNAAANAAEKTILGAELGNPVPQD